MTALRWTRRALDAFLVVAVLAVIATAAIQLLAPMAGGRALVIGGGSMAPTIGRGSFAVVLPAGPEGYAVGDVVTVQQGGATPYTHRITRLAELGGVPYLETKGDANAGPDPALVPTTAVIGRIAVNVPLLGYLALLLGTGAGLAGFLAACATALILVRVIEDLEDERCPACVADAAKPAVAAAPGSASAAGLESLGAFAALPGFAAPARRARVRDTGRARDAATPVLLEQDRRDPRRDRTATDPAPTAPAAAAAPVGTLVEVAADHREEAA